MTDLETSHTVLQAQTPTTFQVDNLTYPDYKQLAVELGHRSTEASRKWNLLNGLSVYAIDSKHPSLRLSIFPSTPADELEPFMFMTLPLRGKDIFKQPKRELLGRVLSPKERLKLYPHTYIALTGLARAMQIKDRIRQRFKTDETYDLMDQILQHFELAA